MGMSDDPRVAASKVITCKGKGADKDQCIIDWYDPDEYDEVFSEVGQCVNFWCGRCEQYVLCSTWIRQA